MPFLRLGYENKEIEEPSKRENCTQVLKKVCRRFPGREPVPVQLTDCKEVEVVRCYTVNDEGVRVRMGASADLVTCEDHEQQLCGLQESTELAYDTCMTEKKQKCLPGYREVCDEAGGLEECREISLNPDGSECHP